MLLCLVVALFVCLTLLASFFLPKTCTCIYTYSILPTRGSSFFFGQVTALGVLCCFALYDLSSASSYNVHVCLFDLACFFLSSFSSLIKNMYMYMCRCCLWMIAVFLSTSNLSLPPSRHPFLSLSSVRI